MSEKIRTVFCGTPEFAVPSLKKLLNDDRFEVVAVVSQPDRPAGRGKKLQASPVKKMALENNLLVLTPESARDEKFQSEIKNLEAKLCVVVAYGQILNKKFLKMFPEKCVNIHSSLLPRWRGAAPMQRALMAGDSDTGVSLQVVVSKLDAGAVIGEKKISIPEDMNAVELHNSLSLLGAELLTHELVDYLNNKIILSQNDLLL